MATIGGDCIRCGVKSVALQVLANTFFTRFSFDKSEQLSEVFCCCPECLRTSIAVVRKRLIKGSGNHLTDAATQREFNAVWERPGNFAACTGSVSHYCELVGFVTIKDSVTRPVPKHLPANISLVFEEGCACLAIGSFNAAAAMFRTALDLATKSLLPEGTEPASKIRRNLGLRLEWMFQNGLLAGDLQDLAECVKDDGNDGAHDGTLTQVDAEDLYDFSFELLRKVFTERARLDLAKARRAARRNTEKG